MANLYTSHSTAPDRLARFGTWLNRNQRWVALIQWSIVALYLALLVIPACSAIPDNTASIVNNVTRFAQFVFWGIWWPTVILATSLIGRFWCGLLCPEGSLSEWMSLRGKGGSLPTWIQWKGWPALGFMTTTIYGQLTSVYQYPKPAALVLGGSTAAAMVVGYRYGKGKRVWCRFLCPVSGVFSILAKVSVLQFEVSTQAWNKSKELGEKPLPVNCAPLVPIRTMKGASSCHMCGRCSGYRGAITLRWRKPGHEIIHANAHCIEPWESFLIIFGVVGLAMGAFLWSASPWFLELKQSLATYLIDHQTLWPLDQSAPWWMLTNYPTNNDVMSLVDGACLLAFILSIATVTAGMISFFVLLACLLLGMCKWEIFHHLVQGLIPIAATGVFLGLTSLTVSQLRMDGIELSGLAIIRVALLLASSTFSLALTYSISLRHSGSRTRAALASIPMAAAIGIPNLGWVLLFWIW